MDAAEAAIFQVAEKRIGQGFMGIPEIVKSSFGSIDKLYEQGQRITGLATHFEQLDNMTSGLQKSDLVIIAARPSMGKTAFAINIAENAAVRDNKVVGVFSLEMSRESLVMRLLCSQAMVDSHKLRTGFLGRDDYNKLVNGLAALVEAPIFIDDTPGISISEMRAKCRRLQQAHGRLDLIIVDYLQLVAGVPAGGGGGKRYENRTQEVSGDLARIEGAGQRDALPGDCAFTVEPRTGEPHRQQSARNWLTCANQEPLSRTPTWWHSFFAKKFISRMTLIWKAKQKSLSPSSVTAQPEQCIWHSSSVQHALRTWPQSPARRAITRICRFSPNRWSAYSWLLTRRLQPYGLGAQVGFALSKKPGARSLTPTPRSAHSRQKAGANEGPDFARVC